jgi:hypothetical protein
MYPEMGAASCMWKKGKCKEKRGCHFFFVSILQLPVYQWRYIPMGLSAIGLPLAGDV